MDPARLRERRARVFLVMAGLFLGTLAMLNILGITRFLVFASYDFHRDPSFLWGVPGSYTFAVAVGVLPYPMTFLCTDLISEFYGRKRANFVVWVGLMLNAWVIFILWVGGVLPGFEQLDAAGVPMNPDGSVPLYFQLRKLAFGAVTASMLAYMVAQFIDVQLFHFWKRLTKGKALWLRNNGSTLVSQAVDTVAVILITYAVGGFDLILGDDPYVVRFLVTLIVTGYVFKFAVALFDTPIIYLAVYWLGPYLRIDPRIEHQPTD